MKITRSAFLYLEGKDDDFAQCGTCVFGDDHCAVMNGRKVSADDGSCGFYAKGAPNACSIVANLSREQTGYVERQVRCGNCKFYGSGHCNLFAQLNRDLPALFDLDEKVSRFGCCNSQEPR